MPKQSAGLLLYRIRDGELQVLLVHPGGPFYKHKDAGAWSIPKGEVEAGEDLLLTAKREFQEEIGIEATGPFIPLQPIQQKSGKMVQAWACAGDCDTANIASNQFSLEWPPKSGQMMDFPEIDRADFFDIPTAKTKINPAQIALIEELIKIVKIDSNRIV